MGEEPRPLPLSRAPFALSIHGEENGHSGSYLQLLRTGKVTTYPKRTPLCVHVHKGGKKCNLRGLFTEKLYFWNTALFKGLIQLFAFSGQTRGKAGRNWISVTMSQHRLMERPQHGTQQ